MPLFHWNEYLLPFSGNRMLPKTRLWNKQQQIDLNRKVRFFDCRSFADMDILDNLSHVLLAELVIQQIFRFFQFCKNWENHFCWFNIKRSQEMLWLILPHWSLYRVSATWKEDYKNWALNGFSRREKHLISSSLFFTSIQLFFYLHSTGESYVFATILYFIEQKENYVAKQKQNPPKAFFHPKTFATSNPRINLGFTVVLVALESWMRYEWMNESWMRKSTGL